MNFSKQNNKINKIHTFIQKANWEFSENALFSQIFEGLFSSRRIIRFEEHVLHDTELDSTG